MSNKEKELVAYALRPTTKSYDQTVNCLAITVGLIARFIFGTVPTVKTN